MKYNYQRTPIDITNWLVNQKDIERIVKFFRLRFSVTEVPISLETKSGNNRTYETYEELVIDLPKLNQDKEIVTKIQIMYRSQGEKNYHHFKQSWISIEFKRGYVTNFFLIAGDTDGSYKDWVEGTYSEINKLKNIFEISDSKKINIIKGRYNSGIVFDPDESIKESIEVEILKEKENANNSIEVILTKKENKGLVERVMSHSLFTTVIGGLIIIFVLYLLYKVTGINFSQYK